MKKIISLFVISTLVLFSANAQEVAETKKEKKYDHYVGVQLNQMINQIFNLNSDNSNLSPYVLNYSINRKSDGWGLNFGVAYVLEDFDEVSGTVTTKTINNDFSIRAGVEQKVQWGEKWLASLGIDILYANLDREETTTDSFGPTITTVKTTSNSYGMGPRGTLHYRLGKRVLLGTEASFYYTQMTNKILNKYNTVIKKIYLYSLFR